MSSKKISIYSSKSTWLLEDCRMELRAEMDFVAKNDDSGIKQMDLKKLLKYFPRVQYLESEKAYQ